METTNVYFIYLFDMNIVELYTERAMAESDLSVQGFRVYDLENPQPVGEVVDVQAGVEI